MATAKRATPAKKAPAKKAPAKAVAKATARPAKPRTRAHKQGPNEKAVVAHVEALRREQQLDTEGEILSALAIKLAALLDVGEPVVMTVAWARELRLTLAALAPGGPADDPDDAGTDSWLADLPSPLRDPEVS